MLTLKHVESDGHEAIYEVEDGVHYFARRDGREKLDQPARVEAFKIPGWVSYCAIFTNGRIFVMNDKGRTIQQYNLDLDNAVAGLSNIEPVAAPVMWPAAEIEALRSLRPPATYLTFAQQIGRNLDDVVAKAKALDIFDPMGLPERLDA